MRRNPNNKLFEKVQFNNIKSQFVSLAYYGLILYEVESSWGQIKIKWLEAKWLQLYFYEYAHI